MALQGFISYAYPDRLRAREVKAELKKFGINCFLAHEDLKPAVAWADEIKSHLKNAKLFIALISDAFCASDWTDQEVGMAVAQKKKIVPLRLGTRAPYGFIAQYQALKLTPTNLRQVAFKIVGELATDAKIGVAVIDGFIGAFLDSGSFAESSARAD